MYRHTNFLVHPLVDYVLPIMKRDHDPISISAIFKSLGERVTLLTMMMFTRSYKLMTRNLLDGDLKMRWLQSQSSSEVNCYKSVKVKNLSL